VLRHVVRADTLWVVRKHCVLLCYAATSTTFSQRRQSRISRWRLGPSMAPNPLKGRIESIAYTYFSIVYAITGDKETVLKGEAIWLDGKEYDRRPCASGDNLRREARIYKILGDHDRITRCYGLEVFEGADQGCALRLERAPLGCLREHIVRSPPPADMRVRLRMAVEFAQGVEHVHNCGVIWGDLSTRNALLFDGLKVKLCDFAGALLPGVFDNITNEYEVRYCPTGPEEHWPAVGTVERELYALGTAIYEIIEWKVPYGTDVDEQDVDKALNCGERPGLTPDNPAQTIIEGCWDARYNLAQEVVAALIKTYQLVS
jgi:serine/threonine protein kinase